MIAITNKCFDYFPAVFIQIITRAKLSSIAGVVVLFCFMNVSAAIAADNPKVLVLHSYHSGFQWTDDQNAAIIKSLLTAYPEGDVFVEYMNTKRVALDVMSPMLRRNYATLFRNARFNVIIATDNNALDFMLKYGEELFSGVPVVFCGINNFDDYNLSNRRNYTGVREDFDTGATLDIALRFHPGTHTVAMIADVTESSQITLAIARKVAQDKKYGKIRFIELSGLSETDLAEKLDKLEKGTIILLLSYYRSPEGRVFSVKDGTQLIQKHTQLPVYALWDFYMLPPVIGGKIVTGTLQGKAAGEIAIRILKGEKPDAIPPYSCPTSYYFNFDALQKFNIPDSLIPEGSIVAGKPDTFYAKYKIYVRIGAAFALGLIVTILILLRGIVLQRRNEAALRASEEKLHKLNRELQAIRNCDQILMRATDEQALLGDICSIICEKAGYRMAWVGYAEFDDTKSVRAVANSGVEDGYLANANITWDDSERGYGPIGTAIRSGESACIQDFATDPKASPWRDNALQRGYRSSIALPLKDENKHTFGVLSIYATEPNAFTADEKRLLEELSGDLEFGIMVLRARIERKRTEESLRQSEERFRRLAENARDLIYRMSLPDGKYEYVSPAALTVVGYSPEEYYATPMLIRQAIHPDWHEYFEEQWANLSKGKMPPTYEYQFIHKSGEVRWLNQRNILVRDDAGTPIAIEGIVTDITERKRAEEALRRSEEQHRTILQTAMDGFWLVDAQGRLLEVNEAYCRMSGYSTQELLAMHIPDLEAAETVDDTSARIQKIKVLGEDRFESRHCRKNGSGYDIEISVQSRPADGGQMVVFLRDITERKRSEEQLVRLNDELEQRVRDRTALLQRKTEELEQANERLKEVDRLKSTFIASMSHELRTPLNAVIGFSTILLDEWLGPVNTEQKQNLASILSSGRHLLNMITDVLDVTQIEAGTIKPVIEEFDLHDLLTEAENQVSADMREKGLELHSDLLRQRMRTDRRRLLQCVMNILNNAVKFTDKGSVTVEARIVPFSGETPEEEMVEIAVTDTGIGINEEDQSRIFQPFHRIVTPQRAIVPGTGLGLFLTRKIATEILKGDLLVSSEYGKGSRFTLRIPVRLP